MSVERQGSGSLRLACDGDWCSRKFSPRAEFLDVSELRWRAITYGWLTEPAPQQQPSIPGIDAGARMRDLCPDCRRRP